MISKELKLKVFFAIGLGLCASARADSLADAQARRAQALNDYFTALQTGHVSKPADEHKLFSQTVGEASDAVVQQMHENRRNAVQELLAPATAKQAQGKSARGPASDFSAPRTVQDNSEPIDGSQTPAQLEFRKAKRRAYPIALPPPAPSN